MFKKNGSEKKLAQSLNIQVENLDEFLKRMSGFLNGRKVISKRNIADALFILQDIQKKESDIASKRISAIIRNPLTLKYNTKMMELYQAGYGYVRISKALKIDHNVDISKSTVARFIKEYGITRDG